MFRKKVLSIAVSVFVLLISVEVYADSGSDVSCDDLQALQKIVNNLQSKYNEDITRLNKEIKLLKDENKNLKKDFVNKETLQAERLNKYEQAIKHVSQGDPTLADITDGVTIGYSATSVVQGVVSGANGTQGDKTDATWTADLEISKEFENGGLAFAHVEMGQGNGLDEDEVTFLSSINRDAGDSSASLEVTELYYEQPFAEDRFVITAGKIDSTCFIDDNEIANDETAQFLSGAFRNNSTIEFPDNNFGIRLGVDLLEGVLLNVGVVEGDGDFEDVADGVFSFAQVAVSSDFFDREGTYRFYGWYSGSDHTAIKDSLKTKENLYGLGVSFDQALTDSLTWFGRFGWAEADVSSIEYAWSSGVQVSGDVWNRSDDYLGIAVGQNILGSQVESSGTTNHKEGQLEFYYNYQVFDYLSVSPHLQVIWNPNGVSEESIAGASDSAVVVAGLRSQLSF